MLDKLTSADFSPYLNQTFRIHPEAEDSLETTLIEVHNLGSDKAQADESEPRRPFSIILRGPADSYLPQSIYQVEHEKIGTLALFLVPIGPDQEGMRYEVLFA